MGDDYALKLNRDAQVNVLTQGAELMGPGGRVVFVTSHQAHFIRTTPTMPEYVPVALSKRAGEDALRERIPALAERGIGFVVDGIYGLFNRVFKRTTHWEDATKTVTVTYHSVEDAKYPHTDELVRGIDHGSFWKFTVVDATHTRVEAVAMVDPQGSLPSWLFNSVQRAWPRDSIHGLVADADALASGAVAGRLATRADAEARILHAQASALVKSAAEMRDLADRYSEGRWLAVGGGGYGLVRVVPRAWTHLIAAALDREIDGGIFQSCLASHDEGNGDWDAGNG